MLPEKSKYPEWLIYFSFFVRNNKTVTAIAMFCVALIISMWIFASKLTEALKSAKTDNNNIENTEEQQPLALEDKQEADIVNLELPTAKSVKKNKAEKTKVSNEGTYILYAYNGSQKVSMERNLNNDLAYIEKFNQIAKSQMRRYNIPASIKLAQGLLESNAGTSQLASKHNNHFGIKCWEKGCGVRMHDDSPDDRFYTYKTANESYEAHSEFLSSRARYKHLFQLQITDYKNWALGLRAAGYATNKHYAACLIALIERYNLQSFDKQ